MTNTKTPWWQYLDKIGGLLFFSGIALLSRNAIIAGTLIGLGAIMVIIFFFNKQKND